MSSSLQSKTNEKTVFTLWFCAMVVLIEILLFSYWWLVLAPRIEDESSTYANLLAESKSSTISNILSNMQEGAVDTEQLTFVLDRIILSESTYNNENLFLGVQLETDLGGESISLSRGALDCNACPLIDIPLYTNNFDEINGVVGFYINPQVLDMFLNDMRNKVYVEALLILLIAFVTWLASVKLVLRLSREVEARKKAEQQSDRERARANEANRAKSLFLASVSHELRTPLNSIIVTSQLLNEDALSTVQKQRAEQVIRSSQLLLNLINDILDLTKLESNKIALEAIPFDFRKEIQLALSLFDDEIVQKGLASTIQIDDSVPLVVLGDPTRFAQILINLYSNAIKFTDTGEISAHIFATQEADHVRLNCHVRDTGIGMTPAQIQNAFKIFSQAEASVTRRFGGTGLGLAIAKYLVNLMGGDIHVESQPEVGSTFKFFVRFRPHVASELFTDGAVEVFDYKRYTWPNTRVLLVEDMEINQRIVCDLLRLSKINLDIVPNGKRALESISEHHYDLVFMDIQMPIMDGIEAVKELREVLLLTDLPIVALSAQGKTHHNRNVKDLGFTSFIEKPISIEKFFATLMRYLPKQRLVVLDRATDIEENLGDIHLSEADFARYAKVTGDVRSAISVYRKLVDDKTPIFQLIEHKIQNRQFSLCQYDIHSLKGVCANLFAHKIATQLAELKDACTKEDQAGCLKIIARVQDAFDVLASEVRVLEAKYPTPSSVLSDELETDSLTDLFERIEMAIENQSFEIEALVQSFCTKMQRYDVEQSRLNRLIEAAANYDFIGIKTSMAEIQDIWSAIK